MPCYDWDLSGSSADSNCVVFNLWVMWNNTYRNVVKKHSSYRVYSSSGHSSMRTTARVVFWSFTDITCDSMLQENYVLTKTDWSSGVSGFFHSGQCQEIYKLWILPVLVTTVNIEAHSQLLACFQAATESPSPVTSTTNSLVPVGRPETGRSFR